MGLFAWLAYKAILLFVLPYIAGVTGVCVHTQPLVERGLANFLPGLALNHNPPDFSLLGHYAWLNFMFLKMLLQGWGCSSVVECLTSIHRS
jgi:hypothetical protein